MTLDYDILVIGGGHAGCEAASAAARMGSRTLLLTMDMTKLANMSCNPAVGGVAKGQIVREIDALGGRTARITDRTTLQFRMLNRSKGAAMWSPRAQCDKGRFSAEWRHELENTQNLYIWQDAATELLFAPAPETNAAPSDNLPDETTTSFNSAPGTISSAAESDADSDPTLRNAPSAAGKLAIRGVRTRMGVEFSCRKVILTSGTFLGGVMHCGASHAEGGRAGDAASHGITESLRAIGFETGRMKTGTPATPGPSISKSSNHNTATKTPPNSPFHPKRNRSKSSFPAFWSTLRKRFTTSSAPDSTGRRCSTVRSAASVRATARRSRTNSAPLPTKTSTSSSWNPKAVRPMNIT